MDPHAFLEALEAALASPGRDPLIAPGDGVLIACSGGPDSTALAFALAAIEARRRRGWRLEIAHLHHGLRGLDADRDRDFAAGVARRLGLRFHERRVDIEEISGREGGSIEECARRERYRFFEEIARANGLARVATAHHRDDQIETVLHRILRGTGIRGLSGIPRRRLLGAPRGAEVIRPFLSFARETVRAYLASLGIEAREDRTNAIPGAFRNKVRLDILPFLRGYAPALDRSLERLARAAAQAHEVVEAEASRRLDAAGIAPRLPLWIPLAAVRETAPPLRPILLLRAVERAAGVQLLSTHAEGLLSLFEAPGAGAAVELPHGLRATREYQHVVVDTKRAGGETPPPAAPVPIAVPGRTEAPAFGVAVETRAVPAGAPANGPEPRFIARFDLAQLPGPLTIRNPRPGDFFYPRGMSGRKKLQDFFVNAKVPRAERLAALLLDAGGQVAWVIGHRVDGRFAATGATREALEVRVEPRI